MSTIIQEIQQAAADIVKAEFGVEIDPGILPVQETRKEFEGDFTIVVFPLTKFRLGAPQQIGERIGTALTDKLDAITGYNVIKGFLNLSLSAAFWRNFLIQNQNADSYFSSKVGEGQKVVVEFCSPNTNKPLHLGHLRNITLGYSLTQILEANGYTVYPTILFNDRGTNISKSMYAWKKAGNNDSPQSLGIKGDKFVGKYYVEFAQLLATEKKDGKADSETESMKAVHDMTVKWEEGDEEIRSLWEQMNGWVYKAFYDTFARLGVSYDQAYYESQVYQRGKETVEEGLNKGLFYTTDDGSVEVDLSDDGLDKKTLLRSNGTSLYITQDLAVAEDKYNEFKMDKSIYVVGNEQDYHFKVLFKVLQKLEKPYGEGLYHLSYGMVDLPTGKMKSREGTTVDADDLMDDMEAKAREETQKNPDRVEGMSPEELNELGRIVGIGALKYYLAKVDPKKRMLFDPNESIDLKGNTGPFIQYSYTRTQAVKRKSEGTNIPSFDENIVPEEEMLDSERTVLKLLFKYPEVLKEAGEGYNPALMANYSYELAKEYNRFYHEAKILRSDFPNTSAFRFAISNWVGEALKNAMALLGIQMPGRM